MSDSDQIIIAAFGTVLALAATIGAVAVWQRRPKQLTSADGESDDTAAEGEPAAATTGSPKKKKKKAGRDKGVADDPEDEARASLPEIRVGTRCWHRQAKECSSEHGIARAVCQPRSDSQA
jgi:hypothetical protein